MSDATLEAFIMILEVSFILIYDVESIVITYDNFQSMIIICNMFIVQEYYSQHFIFFITYESLQ